MPGETLVLVPEEPRSKGFLGHVAAAPGLSRLRRRFGTRCSGAGFRHVGDGRRKRAKTRCGRWNRPWATPDVEEEEIETGSGVSDSEAPEAVRITGEDDEGWFRNFLQYLDDTVSDASGGRRRFVPSLPDYEPDR